MTVLAYFVIGACLYFAGACSAMSHFAAGARTRHRMVDYQRAWGRLLLVAVALAFLVT